MDAQHLCNNITTNLFTSQKQLFSWSWAVPGKEQLSGTKLLAIRGELPRHGGALHSFPGIEQLSSASQTMSSLPALPRQRATLLYKALCAWSSMDQLSSASQVWISSPVLPRRGSACQCFPGKEQLSTDVAALQCFPGTEQLLPQHSPQFQKSIEYKCFQTAHLPQYSGQNIHAKPSV